MNPEDIYEECDNIVSNNCIGPLLCYFAEYRSQRKDFAKNFKKAFCQLVDDILADLEREEKEDV